MHLVQKTSRDHLSKVFHRKTIIYTHLYDSHHYCLSLSLYLPCYLSQYKIKVSIYLYTICYFYFLLHTMSNSENIYTKIIIIMKTYP